MEFDTTEFKKLLEAKMPFGKYSGRRIADLPENYLVWFSKKGFPEGILGQQLAAVYEIKLNGLDHLLRKST